MKFFAPLSIAQICLLSPSTDAYSSERIHSKVKDHSNRERIFKNLDASVGPSKRSGSANATRRSFFTSIQTFAAATAIIASKPTPSNAEFIGSGAMILKYPDLQYLVPIYTFSNVLTVLSKLLSPEAGASGIKGASKLVDNLFKGGFLSNKNVIKGLCAVYCQEIKYDDPYRERVRQDADFRLKSCDMTLDALKKMQEPLQILVSEGETSATPEVLGYLAEARDGLRDFFSQVPPNDLDRVRSWMQTVSAADTDRNGKVEGDELNSLSTDDLKLYNAVGDFIGR